MNYHRFRTLLPIALSTLLAIPIILGSKQLSGLRQRHEAVRKEAARLGILPEESGNPGHKVRPRSETKAVKAEQVLPLAIAYLKECQKARKDKTYKVVNREQRFAEIFDQFKLMSAGQISALVSELYTSEEIPIDASRDLILTAIDALLVNSPADGLDLHVKFIGLTMNDLQNGQMQFAIGRAIAVDPMATLDWMRRNLKEHSALIGQSPRSAVVHAIALTDRKLAFQLINELELDPYVGTQTIVSAQKTSKDRIDVLSELREYLPRIKNKSERWQAEDYAIAILGKMEAREGFDSATQWTEIAGMSPREIGSFGKEIGDVIKPGEEGEWLEWFDRKLAGTKDQRWLRNIFRTWTENNYQAAGKWLAATPTGNLKNTAVGIYATEISKYEPRSAVQWAVTLSPGPSRDELLHKIYHNWPKDDPESQAAAAEYEQQYQIRHEH